jgi:2-pyrone-4,6-dicarboxylate lactonase
VIVQSVIHGFDNRVVEDAIRAGEGRYLGIALVATDVADAELLRLAEAGFRGVRFNFTQGNASAAHLDAVIALTPRLKAVGMHLQVQLEQGLIHGLAATLRRSAVPVVLDHMARVQALEGAGHPDVLALRALLTNPQFHVKLSGVDRIDAKPPYAHGAAIARQLLTDFPEQCVWGTDWPHPSHTHIPDDGVLVDALANIALDSAALAQLLVHNPQRLYRF